MIGTAPQQEILPGSTVNPEDTGEPSLVLADRVSACLDVLAQATRILKKAKALADEPVPAQVERAAADLAACDLGQVGELTAVMKTWVERERATRGTRLRADLRAACSSRDLPLGVLSRDPLELFLAPISVRIDADADRADLTFARIRLGRCRADGAAIVAMRDEAVEQLEGDGWEAVTFLDQLREAWARAGGGGWAELADVLPELALLKQSAAFRKDPTAVRFLPYPRVQFAYDLWRLRRDRCLAAGGWRLTLGTATGGSTRDKSRVLWLEDGRGGGQYHLTLRFVREGTHA